MISQPTPSAIPHTPGVYLFKKGSRILYVGKAANLRARLAHYWRKNAGAKVRSLIGEATRVNWETTDSEIDALLREAELIKTHQPQFNVVMRDDKNYFYVGITKEKFPKLVVTHQLGNSSTHKTRYLGPYTSGSALKITLKLLRRLFPYCTCKMPHTRPCLNAQIGRCLGYCCTKNWNHELRIMNYGVYGKNIKNIIAVLSGKRKRLLTRLTREMKNTAKREEFERAALLRNQVAGLENIFTHTGIMNQELGIRTNTASGWRKIQRNIQNIFNTKKSVSRVEGYDISNISGTEATGSMVVFVDGAPVKSEYRKFKIRTVRGANDVSMHREVMRRRLARRDWPMPDLILMDGGKAQLGAAKYELRIPGSSPATAGHYGAGMNYGKRPVLAALAKREEELYTEGRKTPIRLSSLPEATALFFRHVRDESHRFAKKYHHKLRELHYRSLSR